MAKEQDLSLNPQKISGVCGRLMCCLRYEYEAYKDFHGRAPKKNAKIATPEGEGKVVDLDVPREIVSIKVGDEKPVKIPLADMEAPEEGARPNAVGEEAWERANEPAALPSTSALNLFSTQLDGKDQLAKPGTVRHVHGEDGQKKPGRSRSRRRGSSGSGQSGQQQKDKQSQQSQQPRKQRRRRSTTVTSDGVAKVEVQPQQHAAAEGDERQKSSQGRRRRNRSSARQQGQGNAQQKDTQRKTSQVGRNSSALRASRQEAQLQKGDAQQAKQSGAPRRRRRSHKANQGDSADTAQQ
jgi:hypothetical protein